MPAGEQPPNVLDTVTGLRATRSSSSSSSVQSWETDDLLGESDIPAQLLRTWTLQTRSSPFENLRLRPGPERFTTVHEGGSRINSLHGSIVQPWVHASPTTDNRQTIYGNPRPAPTPPTKQRLHHELNRGVQPETSFNVCDGDAILVPDARNVPYGSNDRPDPPKRAGTFSNSIRQGLKRIGTFTDRPLGVAGLPIKVVKNQDHELSKPTISIEEAQAKKAAERQAYLEANPTADADKRYPNALPSRRGLARAQTSASPPASRPAQAPSAEPRRVRRLSGDSRRQTTFGGFIDACNRSDTSSESGRDDLAELHRVTDGVFPRGQASRNQDDQNRQTWQTADILNVRGLEPLDVDFTGCKGEPAPVAPDSLPARPIRRKPVPEANTGVNKPLPELPLMPRVPRNSSCFGAIPQDAAEAFGCDDNGDARIVPSKEDLDEAAHKAQRVIAEEGRDTVDDFYRPGSVEYPNKNQEPTRTGSSRRTKTRRPSDDGVNESIESQIRRYNLNPDEEEAMIQEAYRLKEKLPRRPASGDDEDAHDDLIIDHIVRDGHVSVLVTKQVDRNTVESFRSRMPRNDYTNENNDEAAALHARLERASEPGVRKVLGVWVDSLSIAGVTSTALPSTFDFFNTHHLNRQVKAVRMASEASQRQAGLTAHVKTPRFFFADTYDSRRPSYASTTSKYSQPTPKPVDGATFATRTRNDPMARAEHSLRFRSEPIQAQHSVLQAEMPNNTGSVGKSSHPRPLTFEEPRPAPKPRQQGPPLAFEKHRQSRTRSLSNSFKEGIQRLGSLTRRRSSIDKDSIKPVRNSMRGDECGLGGKMTAEESARFMLEAKLRQEREEKAKARSESKRQAQDEVNRRLPVLAPKRELRHVQGTISTSTRGLEMVSQRKMRTLSGATDRMSVLGPLVDAGPQNIILISQPQIEENHASAGSIYGVPVNQDMASEQQQGQLAGLRRINDAIWWHPIKLGKDAQAPGFVPTNSMKQSGSPTSIEVSQLPVSNGVHRIKRKPVSPPKEIMLPPSPKFDVSPLRGKENAKRSTFAERISAENIDDSGIGGMDFEDEDDGAAVLFPEQQVTSAQRTRRGTGEDGSFIGDANDFDIDSTVIEACQRDSHTSFVVVRQSRNEGVQHVRVRVPSD
ncbi:hypothetical protein LTR17_018571 [Elasticomyces elasticus]|nr:hypothetical protein LTR17_018571 [Elasticomyces elasticus]